MSAPQSSKGRDRSAAGGEASSEALTGREAVRVVLVASKLWALAPHDLVVVDASHLENHVFAHAKQDH